MATQVPAPILDLRNGDQVVAQAIGALPQELSDRSDSNPAVVLLEASGAMFDKLIYQLNKWPLGAVQKLAALVGINFNPATPASTTQAFTLTNPGSLDTVVKAGTQVSTSDGAIVFSTLTDTTVAAYTAPSGTVSLTSGSPTVTGSGTAFVTGLTWVGWQIQIPASTGAWYTISAVGSSTSLTLTSSALTNQTTVAWNVGPVTASATAQATTSAANTNVGAGKLSTLVSSPAGVASTTNAAAATGGNDLESLAALIARLPTAFAARDVACSASDYAAFAVAILGAGGRAIGIAGYNLTVATAGYVTVALLSPAWTTTTPVAATERANVVRDLAGRTFIGATTIDTPATIQSFLYAPTLPVACVWRKAAYDAVSTRIAVGQAINTYLSPNTYPWGRTIFTGDLVGVVEAVPAVDRVAAINGVSAIGMSYGTTAGTCAFVNGSTTATLSSGDVTTLIGAASVNLNKVFLVDAVNNSVYLITASPTSTTVTIAPAFAGVTATNSAVPYLISGDTALTNSYTLPYSNLTTTVATPPATIFVVGSV